MRMVPVVLLGFAFALCASFARAEDSDIRVVRDRLAASQRPREAGDILAASRAAAEALRTERPDGSWPGIDYADKDRAFWKLDRHLGNLVAMAIGYATPGQPLHGDAKLLDGLRRGLSYWEEHDFQNPNWWYNQIGVPMRLGNVLIQARDALPPDLVAKGVEIMKRSKWTPGQGENTVWMANISLARGLIQEDSSVVADAFNGVYGEIHLTDRRGKEGIMPDWSFHQHGDQLYSGGYGWAFALDTAADAALGWGTRFQIPAEPLRILTNYLLDGERWIVRGFQVDYSTIGRQITREDSWAPKSIPALSPPGPKYGPLNAMETMAALPIPRRAEFAAEGARLRQGPWGDFTGNKHFWWSDYMAHHRPGWFASIKMLSDRMQSAELVNSEGKRSHHLSDGATFLYSTPDEYHNIFPAWDWEKVPGTTVERLPDPFDLKKVSTRGGSGWVGGVTDGTYGLAAMDLVHEGLSAKKAWFAFDDEMVCLGAGITCANDDEVLTTVNQCLLRGPVYVNGRMPDVPVSEALRGPVAVLHESFGYVFPDASDVRLEAGPRTGRWSDIGAESDAPVTTDVFTLWLSHGRKPVDASYAYIVVPGQTLEGLSRTAKALPVSIVANTKTVQAVRHRALPILMAAFRAPGSVRAGKGWTARVDRPCLLMLREVKDGLEVCAANPENKPLTVHVTVDRPLSGAGATPAPGGTTLTLDLPSGDQAGSTLVRTFRERTAQ